MKIKKLYIILTLIFSFQTMIPSSNNPFLYIKNIPKKIAAYLEKKDIEKLIYITPFCASTYTYYLIHNQNKDLTKSLFHGSLFYLLLNTIIYKILNLKKENLAEEYFFHIEKYQDFIQLYQLINLQYFTIIEKCDYLLNHTSITHNISPSQQLKLIQLSTNFDLIFDTTQKLLAFDNKVQKINESTNESIVIDISHNVENLMLNAYIEFANIMKMLIKNINEAQNNYCK